MSMTGGVRFAAVLLALAAITGCDEPVHDPWLGEAQRGLYQQDQYQRSPEAAQQMRERLQYRVADR